MRPDRPAVQKVRDVAAQGFGDLHGAGEREADHVDHDIGLEFAHTRAKRSGRIFCVAVGQNRLNACVARLLNSLW